MKRTVKAAAVPIVVIVAAAFTVGAVVGIAGTLYFTSKKGGLGDSASLGMMQETEPLSLMETIEAETIETEELTEPLTEPVTNQLNAIAVTVSGNDYIYNGTRLSLDELAGILRVNTELPVVVSDDNASLKAYNDLIDKLNTLGIQYQSEG